VLQVIKGLAADSMSMLLVTPRDALCL
jgi:hypothetical protein